jgi:hypothetical protein
MTGVDELLAMSFGLDMVLHVHKTASRFGGGKRKGKCPYEHLGLNLPSSAFWELLQAELPEALERRTVG